MKRSSRKTGFPGAGYVIASLLMALGLAIAFFSPGGIPSMLLQFESRHWPQVKGTIVSSDVLKRGISGDYSYRASIQAVYQVDGDSYYLSEIYPGQGDVWSGDNAESVRLHDRYDVGDTVDVFLDPGVNERATLETGNQGSSWFLLPFAFVPFLLGLWLLFYSVKYTGKWIQEKRTNANQAVAPQS